MDIRTNDDMLMPFAFQLMVAGLLISGGMIFAQFMRGDPFSQAAPF